MRTLSRFSLPLLAKELTEQSARRRTFALRAVYAGLLYGITLWGFYQQLAREYGGWQSGSFAILGTGQLLFEQVLTFQMFAVFALLPMLTAGVLTSEKERDTLGILLITRLGPWTIVLEKFLSRVIPMLLYLLLSLPLMGVAYSLGGVESGSVLWAAVLLVGTVMHIGSVGVFASAYCRTTTQALMLTYLCLFAEWIPVFWLVAISSLVPLIALFNGGAVPTGGPTGVWPLVWMFTAIGLVPTLSWLLLARVVLWKRAFLQPKNFGLQLLRWLDGFFHAVNQNRVTRGIVLLDERVELPHFQPIAWRETKKRSLGTVRYLTRFLLLVEGPLLFAILIPLTDNQAWAARQNPLIEFASFAVWWVTVFAVLSQSTALVAGERSRQSLDVLLSTPLSAERIIAEKFAGVRRLILVLWVPLATLFLFRGWWFLTLDQRRFDGVLFIIQSLGSAIIYPPLLGWLGLHCSLRFKSQVTAMTAALGTTLVLGGLPWALGWIGVFHPNVDFGGVWRSLTTILLPATGPSAWIDTSYRGRDQAAWRIFTPMLLIVHFVLYAAAWQLLWWLAPRQFIRLTGRCEQTEHAEPVAIHHLRDRRLLAERV